jgi:hypothetical protein
MATALSQLILKRGLMTTEKQQNVLYQSIEIEAGIRRGDVGQPFIFQYVSLVIGVNNRRRPRGTSAVHHVIPINVTETTI